MGFAENITHKSFFFQRFQQSLSAWIKFWIEANCLMVVKASTNPLLSHWRLRNNWKICLDKFSNTNIAITCIYGEENSCDDFLVNIALSTNSLIVFVSIPIGIRNDFVKNMLDIHFRVKYVFRSSKYLNFIFSLSSNFLQRMILLIFSIQTFGSSY